MRKTMGKTMLAATLALSLGMTGGMLPNQAASAAKKTVKVTKISVSKKSVTLEEGKTKKITVKVTPSKASNKKVTFTSNDKKIATVSAKGVITAKKAGTATVTVKAKDGSGKKATISVTVTKKPVVVEGVNDGTMTTYKLSANKSYKVVTKNPKTGEVTTREIKAEDLQQIKDSVAQLKASGMFPVGQEKCINLDEVYGLFYMAPLEYKTTFGELKKQVEATGSMSKDELNLSGVSDSDEVTVKKEEKSDTLTVTCGFYSVNITINQSENADQTKHYKFSAFNRMLGEFVLNASQLKNDIIKVESVSAPTQADTVINAFVKGSALVTETGDVALKAYYGTAEDAIVPVIICTVNDDDVTVSMADVLADKEASYVTIYEL